MQSGPAWHAIGHMGVRAGADMGPAGLPSYLDPRIFLTARDSGTAALTAQSPGIHPSCHPAEILSPELAEGELLCRNC